MTSPLRQVGTVSLTRPGSIDTTRRGRCISASVLSLCGGVFGKMLPCSRGEEDTMHSPLPIVVTHSFPQNFPTDDAFLTTDEGTLTSGSMPWKSPYPPRPPEQPPHESSPQSLKPQNIQLFGEEISAAALVGELCKAIDLRQVPYCALQHAQKHSKEYVQSTLNELEVRVAENVHQWNSETKQLVQFIISELRIYCDGERPLDRHENLEREAMALAKLLRHTTVPSWADSFIFHHPVSDYSHRGHILFNCLVDVIGSELPVEGALNNGALNEIAQVLLGFAHLPIFCEWFRIGGEDAAALLKDFAFRNSPDAFRNVALGLHRMKVAYKAARNPII